jgi:hypothetical protein
MSAAQQQAAPINAARIGIHWLVVKLSPPSTMSFYNSKFFMSISQPYFSNSTVRMLSPSTLSGWRGFFLAWKIKPLLKNPYRGYNTNKCSYICGGDQS